MADRTLELVIKAEVDKAVKNLKKVDGATKSTKSGFEGLKKAAGFAVGAFTAVAAAAAAVGAASLKSAADFQKQKVAFEVMLGSATKAQTLLEEIEKFSASTPFQMPGLITGSKRLLAFGVSQEKVIKTMKNLGNAAMGNQAVLDRLVDAYGKLKAKGKASLEELNRFTEAGVPILQELANQFNTTTEEILDMVTKGKIGFDEVDKALISLTNDGGQFAGMIEKMSETTEGRFSTMIDNFNLAGKAMGENLLPIADDLINIFTDFAKELQTNEDMMAAITIVAQGLGEVLKLGLTIIGETIKAFGQLARFLGLTKNGYSDVSKEAVKSSEFLSDQADKIDTLGKRFNELRNKQNKSKEEQKEIKQIIEELNSLTDGRISKIHLMTGELSDLNKQLNIEKNEKKQLAIIEARRALQESMKEEVKIQEKYWAGVKRLKQLQRDVENAKTEAWKNESKRKLASQAKDIDIFLQNKKNIQEERKEIEKLITDLETAAAWRFVGLKGPSDTKKTSPSSKSESKITKTSGIDKELEASALRLEIWGNERDQFIANLEERYEKYQEVLGNSVELEKWKKDQITEFDMDVINQRHEAANQEYDQKNAALQAEVEAQKKAEEEKTKNTKKEAEERRKIEMEVAKSMYSSFTGMVDSMFEARISGLNKESAEYKKAMLDQFNWNKAKSIADIGISTFVAATKALELGPIAGPIAAAAISAMGLANAAMVASQEPPAFAQGGSFLTSGEQMIKVGDNSGGVEQVDVTPLSSFGSEGGRVIDQPFIIQIDSMPIYKGMLRASKDRIMLIDSGAVV